MTWLEFIMILSQQQDTADTGNENPISGYFWEIQV
jgi:predicted secreted protein